MHNHQRGNNVPRLNGRPLDIQAVTSPTNHYAVLFNLSHHILKYGRVRGDSITLIVKNEEDIKKRLGNELWEKCNGMVVGVYEDTLSNEDHANRKELIESLPGFVAWGGETANASPPPNDLNKYSKEYVIAIDPITFKFDREFGYVSNELGITLYYKGSDLDYVEGGSEVTSEAAETHVKHEKVSRVSERADPKLLPETTGCIGGSYTETSYASNLTVPVNIHEHGSYHTLPKHWQEVDRQGITVITKTYRKLSDYEEYRSNVKGMTVNTFSGEGQKLENDYQQAKVIGDDFIMRTEKVFVPVNLADLTSKKYLMITSPAITISLHNTTTLPSNLRSNFHSVAGGGKGEVFIYHDEPGRSIYRKGYNGKISKLDAIGTANGSLVGVTVSKRGSDNLISVEEASEHGWYSSEGKAKSVHLLDGDAEKAITAFEAMDEKERNALFHNIRHLDELLAKKGAVSKEVETLRVNEQAHKIEMRQLKHELSAAKEKIKERETSLARKDKEMKEKTKEKEKEMNEKLNVAKERIRDTDKEMKKELDRMSKRRDIEDNERVKLAIKRAEDESYAEINKLETANNKMITEIVAYKRTEQYNKTEIQTLEGKLVWLNKELDRKVLNRREIREDRMDERSYQDHTATIGLTDMKTQALQAKTRHDYGPAMRNIAVVGAGGAALAVASSASGVSVGTMAGAALASPFLPVVAGLGLVAWLLR